MKMRADMERILREWDVPAATALFADLSREAPLKPDVAEAGMHKARVAAGPKMFGAAAVRDSRDWLKAHGYSDTIGR